jgi:methylthioribose-1-phosphate isomerase
MDGTGPEARLRARTVAVRWQGGPNGFLDVLDQTRLPREEIRLRLESVEDVRAAICRLSVRGAPAIGVAAACGFWIGIRDAADDPAAFETSVARTRARLLSARPTAVNLAWALRRVEQAASRPAPVAERKLAAYAEAQALLEEDVRTCRTIGEVGVALLANGGRVLTYCNTGALAAAGSGTALAIVFEAARRGVPVSVIACETRPLLQGSRLTMWELGQAGIEATLICDNAAATVMKDRRVDCVLVGADRIARNGDAANKIGTYGLALLAKAHGTPFHVVAPRSSFDPGLANGGRIPIEERASSEVTEIGGTAFAPAGARVYAPAFDVTPAGLITSIVTEAGIISPVDESTVTATLKKN